jgi:hypothetical protein
MAISPLALGIGLQGKYDYRQQAALEIARSKGRAKAEADAETARAKKLAPIERRLINMRGAPLLPVHQKEVTRKVTEALDYMMEHPEDLSGVTQRAYDIEASTKAFGEQYNSYKKSQFGKNVKGNAEAIRMLGISDNADDLADGFAGIAGSTIKFDPQSKNVTFEPIDYLPTSTHINKAFQAGGTQYYDATGKEPTVKVGKKVYTNFGLNPAVPEMIKQDILKGRDKVIALTNDYSQYLESNNQPLPNLRTAEGKEEFNNGMVAFLDESIAQEFANRGLLKDITPGQGRNIYINNAPPLTPGEIGAPAQIGVKVVYSGGQRSDVDFSSTSLGFLPRFKDFTITLPTSVGTFYAATGDQVPSSGSVTATYNGADAHYVASKDVKIPSHWQGFPDGGGSKFIPEKNIKKGQLVDDSEVETLKKQKALDVKFVVFGLTDKNQSIYRTYDEAGIAPILQMSTADKKLVNEAIKDANEKYKAARAELYGTSAPAPTPTPAPAPKPKPAPTPAPTPTGNTKPKGDVNKDKAAPVVPNVNTKVKTAEQQASDARMKKLMEGK